MDERLPGTFDSDPAQRLNRRRAIASRIDANRRKLAPTPTHLQVNRPSRLQTAIHLQVTHRLPLRTTTEMNRRPTRQRTIRLDVTRVRTALGKVVHGELANLKRLYKAEGFREAEIHAVIPDRPGKTKKVETKVEAVPPSVQP